VLLLEKTARFGWKLSITGKGRCNVTNDCGPEEVLKNIPTNARFLYSSLWGFPPEETKALFERLGVPLKTERGQRVFPVSDKAGDIVSALLRYMDKTGVIRKRGTVTELLTENGSISGVRTEKETYRAAKVILATGGKSYPNTGSTGDGYRMAERLGHTVTPISGSLVPLEILGGECRKMAGLSLRNVGLKLYGKKKKPVYSDFGEALFMNCGLSGPIILSASAHMDEKNGPYALELDLKPALDEKKLEARLLRDFEERKNERIYEGLRGLLPGPLVPVILDRCEIPTDCPVNSVTREQRRRILETVKGLRFSVAGKRPVEEAIITHGGVQVSQVNPSTMESKLVPGLYFAGEILDCDAYTGGFNLQIAWSTAYAAGTSCGNLQETVL
jgi:predicted Rossmann fold flavoprotein